MLTLAHINFPYAQRTQDLRAAAFECWGLQPQQKALATGPSWVAVQ